MEYEVIGTLKAEEYWQWKALTVQMFLAEQKAKNAILNMHLAEKDLELQRLKINLLKSSVDQAQNVVINAKEEYTEFRSRLEASLGAALKDCLIDEISGEVRRPLSSNQGE